MCPLIKEEAIDVVSLIDVSQAREITRKGAQQTKSYHHPQMQSQHHHPSDQSQSDGRNGKCRTPLNVQRQYRPDRHLVRVAGTRLSLRLWLEGSWICVGMTS